MNKGLLVAAAIGTRPNDKERVRALVAAGTLPRTAEEHNSYNFVCLT